MTQCKNNSSKESPWQQVAAGLQRLKFHVRSTRNKHFPITSRDLPRGPDEPQKQRDQLDGCGCASISKKVLQITPGKK